MNTKAFDNFAGFAALVVGIGGVLYSVAFVFLYVFGIAPDLGLTLASLILVIGGILTVAVLVALFYHTRETDAAFALMALVLGVAGALGSATHGGYDLANQIHPPQSNPLALADLPSQIDPRGLATFGFAGLALILFGWLMSHGTVFPKRLAQLAYAAGILSVVIYLARLIILSPTNPVVAVVALVTGLIVVPVFYIWLGMRLRALAR